jgi:hypothetical protein
MHGAPRCFLCESKDVAEFAELDRLIAAGIDEPRVRL